MLWNTRLKKVLLSLKKLKKMTVKAIKEFTDRNGVRRIPNEVFRVPCDNCAKKLIKDKKVVKCHD